MGTWVARWEHQLTRTAAHVWETIRRPASWINGASLTRHRTSEFLEVQLWARAALEILRKHFKRSHGELRITWSRTGRVLPRSMCENVLEITAATRRNGKARAAERLFLAALLCFCLLVTVAHAHDIPADITVQAFLKPEGQQLHFLVRVPLKAMRDIEFPKRGPGYLELDRADEFLRDAAVQWISNF